VERFYRPITPYEMVRNTSQSLKQVEHILELAGKFAMDMQKTDRTGEKNNKCICCFYSSRIAGAAITISHCGLCGEKLMAGSTDTNRLCLACAKEHDLCEHCGGDVNLKPNRKSGHKIQYKQRVSSPESNSLEFGEIKNEIFLN
jgi:hypothetical protein